jgi:hypothetical protein
VRIYSFLIIFFYFFYFIFCLVDWVPVRISPTYSPYGRERSNPRHYRRRSYSCSPFPYDRGHSYSSGHRRRYSQSASPYYTGYRRRYSRSPSPYYRYSRSRSPVRRNRRSYSRERSYSSEYDHSPSYYLRGRYCPSPSRSDSTPPPKKDSGGSYSHS